MADGDDRVELTDLDVITRYSLAVRTATAPREELIAALRSDLAWLEGARRRRTTPAEPTAAAPARKPATKKAPAKKAPARKAPAKKATGRR